MDTIKITEKKRATVVLLEAVNEASFDIFNFGVPDLDHTSIFLYSPFPIIWKHIEVKGINYEIEDSAFRKALKYLESYKMIKIQKTGTGEPYGHILADAILEVGDKIHNFKLHGISLDSIQNLPISPIIKEEVITKLEFDESESILSFRGKKIVISKAKNSRPHYISTLIFSNKEKAWLYDEIAEKTSNNPNEYEGYYDWKQYYQACRDINEKIAKETMVKDFLMPTKFQVSINKKYLTE